MNPVPPLPFPGSRTVAAWWRELAPYRPVRLWLSHLLIHRVDALAEVVVPYALNGLRLELLRVLAGGRRPEGLQPGILARLTRDLAGAGLFTPTESGLQLTEAGRHAVHSGSVSLVSLERRSFCFLEHPSARRPPHFLRVRCAGTPVTPPEPWEFDVGVLQAAVAREEPWKLHCGFPTEVAAIRVPEPEDPDWRSIVIDHAEHLFLAFVEVEQDEGGRQLLGFAGQTKNWLLDAREPAVDPGDEWAESLPDLTVDPAEAEWRKAWMVWAQQRGLPPGEAADCRLERSGFSLRVDVPRRLMGRLRDTRSDAVQGGAWLLAGTGRTRAAARLDVSERGA
jgi:hypothetical protein